MPLTAILFIVAGLACLFGLVTSLAQPVWFRFNGKVPSRWEIARSWLLLLAICAIFAFVHLERRVTPTEPVRMDETTLMDGVGVPSQQVTPAATFELDVPVPVEVQDAVKMNEDAAQISLDMPPERPQTPPPPVRSVVPKRAQR